MFRDFLVDSNHLIWPLLAFIVFFLTFVGVLVYVLTGVLRSTSFDRMASLPLEEDRDSTEGGRR